jgi:hypothetical protein
MFIGVLESHELMMDRFTGQFEGGSSVAGLIFFELHTAISIMRHRSGAANSINLASTLAVQN